MKINISKLLSADFRLGKILVTVKAIVDIIRLLLWNPSMESLKFSLLILKVKPKFTMVKNNNLINLYRLVQEANRNELPGALVECGVWNGGSAAVMGYACQEGQYPKPRAIWLFDSFEGLPRPTEKDGEKEKRNYFENWNKGDVEIVKKIFTLLGLNLDEVRIIPGWFESTLKKTFIDTIAVLHIDSDWYNSVKTVLEVFYEKVTPGGFIVLDDYEHWEGCTKALKDFLSEQAIENVVLQRVENGGVYFKKSLETKPSGQEMG